jgi:hypothetical protein
VVSWGEGLWSAAAKLPLFPTLSRFVLCGAVKGGKVYGEWPGLKEHQLHEGRDLALTTDFRDVFDESPQGGRGHLAHGEPAMGM